MPKKHLTSKVLDQHVHACASAQSDQGLWVITVEKRLTWNKVRRPRKHMTTYPAGTWGDVIFTSGARLVSSRWACASGHFEQDLCNNKLYCLLLDLLVTFLLLLLLLLFLFFVVVFFVVFFFFFFLFCFVFCLFVFFVVFFVVFFLGGGLLLLLFFCCFFCFCFFFCCCCCFVFSSSSSS